MFGLRHVADDPGRGSQRLVDLFALDCQALPPCVTVSLSLFVTKTDCVRPEPDQAHSIGVRGAVANVLSEPL